MRKLALALALVAASTIAAARAPKTYQVTGEVLEVADDLIVLQKAKEKFEIARTPETKVTGDLQKGAKVTVEYRMTATTVETKPAKAAKGPKK